MQLQVKIALNTNSISCPYRSTIAINNKVSVRLKNSIESAIVTCESFVSLQTLVGRKSILSTHLRLVLLIHLLWIHLGLRISNNHCSRRGNKFLFNVNYSSIRLYTCNILGEIRVLSHLNSSCRLIWSTLHVSAIRVAYAAKNDGEKNEKEDDCDCCDDSSRSTSLFGDLLLANII